MVGGILKYNSWNKFIGQGEFSIIELNGALSEPTHMYDPSHSYFFAVRELYKHHKRMLDIAIYNYRNNKSAHLVSTKA
ncbi:hypothetical protein GCM10028791_43980 [Echinicola sediminis]